MCQFSRINTQWPAALAEKRPVIFGRHKKKELVGDFRNNGREYRPQGNPEAVRVHDSDQELGARCLTGL